MKLSNLFKNKTTKVVNPKIQSLDKNQLEKVIGGDGETDLKKMKDSVIQNIR